MSHEPLKFPTRTPEQERAWLEKMCEVDDSNISVGGLYMRIAEDLTLNDFAQQDLFPEQYKASFGPGETEIWYRLNSKASRTDPDDMAFFRPKPPRISTLSESHVLLGKVAETHLATIFEMLQGEMWQPMGSPKGSPPFMFLTRIGAEHSSMSIGDVIKIGDQAWMCAKDGWLPLQH
jgi:hypothetical protein